MASLVLGGIGGFLFGPIGFLVGSFLGNLLFPQRGPDPPIQNLKLQVSAYGWFIPIPYGTIRIAGNVIWTTDLKPHKSSSGGKGGPTTTTVSYSASFAVLICEGPVAEVPRIWALGDTLWSKDMGTPCPCKIYLGTDTQLPDPTMEAALGVGNVPGYRNRCYAVFTDFDLTKYGNALPSLNWEVVTSVGAIPWRVSTFTATPQAAIDIGVPYAMSGTYDPITKVVTVGSYIGEQPVAYVSQQFLIDGTRVGSPQVTGPTNLDKLAGIDPSTFGGQVYNLQACYCYHAGSLSAPNGGWYVGTKLIAGVDDGTQFTAQHPVYINGHIYAAAGNVACTINRWVAPNGIPTAVVDAFAFLGAVTSPTNIYCSAGNGKIWVSDSDAAGAATALWLFDEDLLFVHLWTRTELDAALGGGGWNGTFPKISYNGLFAVNSFNGMGGIEFIAYKYNDDFTFTQVGAIPQNVGGVGPQISLIRGLVLSEDGIVSLDPPLVTLTYGDVTGDISKRCDMDPTEYNVSRLIDPIDGYVIDVQRAGRDSILQLQSADYFDGVESSGCMKFIQRGGLPVIEIPDSDLAVITDGEDGGAAAISTDKRIKESDLPMLLNVQFINGQNDYEVGQQSERRQVTSSQQTNTITLKINMTSAKARQVAKVLMFSSWFERDPIALRTSRKYAWLEPTDVITARSQDIRIMQKGDEASNIVALDGVPSIAGIWNPAPVTSGGNGFNPSTPPTAQSTVAVFLDIPLVSDSDTPGFYVAMNGAVDKTWRGATLFQSVDGGVSWNSIAVSTTPSAIGICSNAIKSFMNATFDEGNILHVVLGPGSPPLSSATDLAVLAGANACTFGGEIGCYKNAVLTAPDEYDLSGWIRGRRGTEAFTATHVAGEQFVALPVTNVAMPITELSHTYMYRAVTFGAALADTEIVTFANIGNAIRPYSPAQVGGGCDSDGDVIMNWLRRTRIGGEWVDYIDAPLSELSEGYIVQIWDKDYTFCARIISGLTSQTCTYSAADQITDFGAIQKNVYFTVGQLGSYSLGSQTRGVATGTGSTEDLPIAPVLPYVYPPIVPPPDPGGPVDGNLAWPADSKTFPSLVVGGRLVLSFTTGASVPLTGTIVIAESQGQYNVNRHVFIANDSNGLSKVPHTEAYGTTAIAYIGAAAGGGILAALTTYYFITDFILIDGSLSGVAGAPAPAIINLGNVT